MGGEAGGESGRVALEAQSYLCYDHHPGDVGNHINTIWPAHVDVRTPGLASLGIFDPVPKDGCEIYEHPKPGQDYSENQ